VRIAVVAILLGACAHAPPAHQLRADGPPPSKVFAIELTIAADAAAPGRVSLRVELHGKEPIEIVIPDRPDQVLLIDPDAVMLAEETPSIRWSAWFADNDGLVLGDRPVAAQEPSRHVTLVPGQAQETTVDLAPELDDVGTRHYCARAWLVGGAHPLPSNVVCW
jgi:hypothetical protein